MLNFLYGPILIFMHDYWKNYNFLDFLLQSDVSAF